MKEISRKVSKIQDPSLNDFQLRDLNDEINELFAEKHRWELRVQDLGGPNYVRAGAAAAAAAEGGVLAPGPQRGAGGRRYRYFGRAREIPQVKAMFEAAAQRAKEQREMGREGGGENPLRGKVVDHNYYGWNNDETEKDGALLKYEARREEEMRGEMLRRYEEAREVGGEESDPEWEPLPGPEWRMPTQEEVAAELLRRKQKELIERIGGEAGGGKGEVKGEGDGEGEGRVSGISTGETDILTTI